MVGHDLSSLTGKTLEVAGQVVGFTLRDRPVASVSSGWAPYRVQ